MRFLWMILGLAVIFALGSAPEIHLSPQAKATLFLHGGAAGDLQTVACTNTAATDPGLISTALATGKPVYIIAGTCNLTTMANAFNLATAGQILTGDSIGTTILNVGTNIITNGLFHCTTAVPTVPNDAGYNNRGPIVANMRIVYAQANSATRAGLINFTPTFNFYPCFGYSLQSIRIEECMVCIDTRGISGNAVLEDLEISTLSVGIWADGSAAPLNLNRVQFQPYGAELYGTGNCGTTPVAGLCNLYQTTNVAGTIQSTSGTEGPIGLYTGRADGIWVTNTVFFIGQGYVIAPPSGCSGCPTGQQTHAIISGSAFDTYGGINIIATGLGTHGPVVDISGGTYFGDTGFIGNGQENQIAMAGGTVTCNGCTHYHEGSDAAIAVTGGTLTEVGSHFLQINAGSGAFVECETACTLNLSNITFDGTGCPAAGCILVDHTGGSTGSVANISGLRPTSAGAGAVMMFIGTDNDHRIIGNGKNGWVNACLGTQATMKSAYNGSGANATCN